MSDRPCRVLGVLAGRDILPGQLEAWLQWADRVVAADGGADQCREAGREPDMIVGDLDSISDASGLVADPDQDSSDADKLLAFLEREGVESVTLIGVEGDRLDHVLATLYSCTRTSVVVRIVLRMGAAYVVAAKGSVALMGQGRISVLPLGVCRVTLTGVRWPLTNVELSPTGLVSLSNQGVEGFELRLEVHEGSAALFVSEG